MRLRPPANDAEMDRLWALNHAVFCDELGQHPPRPDGRLVDKFHGKNVYLAAWDGDDPVGMIAAHRAPPFSAVAKFGPALETRLATFPEGTVGEVRLFALRRDRRGAALAARLGAALFRTLRDDGARALVISGVDAQKSLYEHIGFVSVGDPVRDGGAVFHPMIADLDAVFARHDRLAARLSRRRG